MPNSFCEAKVWKCESYETEFNQSMLGFAIDELILLFAPPFPNHLKIDVDGAEKKTLDKEETTLADKRLKSVLGRFNIDLYICARPLLLWKDRLRHDLRA
jgi:hypothetical protein